VFRALADTAVNPFCIIGKDGTFEWVGASIEELLGWTPEEVASKRLDEIVSPATLHDAIEGLAVLDEVPQDYPRAGAGVPAELLRRDGSWTPVDLIGAPAKLTGLPWHIVFAQRTGYQRALDRALEAMAEDAGLPDVLVHLGAAIEQAIPHSSVAVCDRWQTPRFRVAAGSAVDLLLPEPETPWAMALESGEDVQIASADGLSPTLATQARAAGLESCWVHPVAVPGEPEPVAAFVIWRPLAGPPSPFSWNVVQRTGKLLRLTLQWDRSHRALEYAATHDTLTGVANRKVFLDRLREVSKAGVGESAVLFIDLDHFKPVNDDHGHLAGDRRREGPVEGPAAAAVGVARRVEDEAADLVRRELSERVHVRHADGLQHRERQGEAQLGRLVAVQLDHPDAGDVRRPQDLVARGIHEQPDGRHEGREPAHDLPL